MEVINYLFSSSQPKPKSICPTCLNLNDVKDGLIKTNSTELLNDALPDCAFCALITELFWTYVKEDLGFNKYVPFPDHTLFTIKIYLPIDERKRVKVYIVPPRLGGGDPAVRRKWTSVTRELFVGREDERWPWMKFPLSPPTTRPLKVWVDQILEWLSTCCKEHGGSSCQLPYQIAPTWCPTRLLRIDEGGRKLHLIETNWLKVPYTALSYCWGSTQSNRTEAHNIDARRRGSGFNCLPLVHREAIELTYACGLRYIWIDAICIVQGDADEWKRESLKMDDVYSNAAFTISAARCAEAQDSLYSYRSPVSRLSGVACKDQADGPDVLAYVPLKHEPLVGLAGGAEIWPAFKRAWCYQERLLSKRIVHFTPGEMVFECSRQIACECGWTKNQQNESAKWVFETPQRYAGPHDAFVYFTFWHLVVRLASGRNLSHEIDRLVAVAGLAKRYERQTQNKKLLGGYFAGIWEENICHGLSWSTKDDQLSGRPKVSVAPTWSWASVTGEVGYDMIDIENCKRHHARCEEISCDLVGDDAFGQVKGGLLRLFAPVVECVFGGQDFEVLTQTSGLAIETTYHLDIGLDRQDTEVKSGMLLKAICLWSFNSTGSKTTFALLVKRSAKHADSWQRVGLLFISPVTDLMEEMDKVIGWVETLGGESIAVI